MLFKALAIWKIPSELIFFEVLESTYSLQKVSSLLTNLSQVISNTASIKVGFIPVVKNISTAPKPNSSSKKFAFFHGAILYILA